MILAVTGHRPNKLGGYRDDAYSRMLWVAEDVIKRIRPSFVITGMALGWDQACAVAARDLGIPFVAAIPFNGQEAKWPEESRLRYYNLMLSASDIVVVSTGGYSAAKMQMRNEWMVEHCDRVLALWDGSRGGTANCVAYARKAGKPVENCWDDWLRTEAVAA